MTPEVRDKWASALESGQYSQGYSHLFRVDQEQGRTFHCVLGVLEDIDLRASLDLPDTTYRHLTKMNDIDKRTFPEIAQWIRENL